MDCNKQIFYPFIKKAICPLGICLSSLYNDDMTQQLVRNVVEDRFEVLFEQFVNAAKKKKLKTRDMVERKSVMKNLFVEFGLPLESIDDLIFLAITADQKNSIPNYFSFYDMRDHVLRTVELKHIFVENKDIPPQTPHLGNINHMEEYLDEPEIPNDDKN